MPTWPASLPQKPLNDPYQEQAPWSVIQAPVEGPPKSRRRYTAAPKPVEVQFLMTQAQLDTFEAFLDADLKGGSLTYEWREYGDPNRPLYNWRITDAPQYSRRSNKWLVSFPLIRMP